MLGGVVCFQASLLGSAGTATAAPVQCEKLDDLPPKPVAAEAPDELVREAINLANSGHLDTADQLYRLSLRQDPTDAVAAKGLVYDQARRVEAEVVVDAARSIAQEIHSNGELTPGQIRDKKPQIIQCYEEAAFLNADNEEAAAGSSPALEKRTPAQQGADNWDKFFKHWLDPIIRLIVPTLVVLAVLLVLARALTSSLVRTSARAWRDKPRRVSWWGGALLLLLVATEGVSLGVGAGWFLEWLDAPLEIVASMVVPLVAAALVARFSLVPPDSWKSPNTAVGQSTRSAWIVSVVAATATGILLLLIAFLTHPATAWPWVVTAAVACLGLVLAAAGRGHALRLLVQVKKDKGDDSQGTAYVLARLQELGTSPPEGLKTPQQLDVENLPSEALKSLPVGRVASALRPLLTVVLPATPWKAVVEANDQASRIVVTVTRNGSVVRTALVDLDYFLPTPKTSATGAAASTGSAKSDENGGARADTADRGDLLTAGAAVVLTELAQVHRELQKGLCGASRWESVAAHVVATKPPSTAGGIELRRELLAFAVQFDPANALAQLAYINLLGRDATDEPDLRAHATRLADLLAGIETQATIGEVQGTVRWDRRHPQSVEDVLPHPPQVTGSPAAGYLPLRLRARHALAVTWLNIAVDLNGLVRDHAVDQALLSYRALIYLLRMAKSSAEGEAGAFIRAMTHVAASLKDAIAQLGRGSYSDAEVPEPPDLEGPSAPPSLHVLYDQACLDAKLGQRDSALRKLERAAGLEGNREDALTDPWFAPIRTAEGGDDVEDSKRFWAIVGPPSLDFTDLPLFGKQGGDLLTVGVKGAVELYASTRTPADLANLAEVLKVPIGVVASWKLSAELAHPPANPATASRWLTPRELHTLVAAGVRSVGDLPNSGAPAAQKEDFRKSLRRVADELVLRPLDDSEFDEVASRFP
jgi:hypothetical protein